MKKPSKSVLLILGILIPGVLLAATHDRANTAPERTTFTGRVTGWSVTALGTVSLRLEGERSDRPFKLWFSTAANRTSTTHFEQLVLDAVLDLSRHGTKDARVVVTSYPNTERGRSPEEALTLVELRREMPEGR